MAEAAAGGITKAKYQQNLQQQYLNAAKQNEAQSGFSYAPGMNQQSWIQSNIDKQTAQAEKDPQFGGWAEDVSPAAKAAYEANIPDSGKAAYSAATGTQVGPGIVASAMNGLAASTPFQTQVSGGGDPQSAIYQTGDPKIAAPTTDTKPPKPTTPADKPPVTESTRPTQDLPYSKESFGGAKRTRVAANNPITTSAMNGLMGAGTGLQY